MTMMMMMRRRKRMMRMRWCRRQRWWLCFEVSWLLDLLGEWRKHIVTPRVCLDQQGPFSLPGAVWEPSCFPKSAEQKPVDPVWVWVNWLPKTWMLWYALICLGPSLSFPGFQVKSWSNFETQAESLAQANIVLLDRWNHFENVQFGHIHNLEVSSPIFCSFATPTHPPSPASSVWTCPAGPSAWVAHGSPGWGKIMGFPGYSPSLRWYTVVRLFDVIWCGLLLG